MKFHSLEDYGGADSSHELFKGWGWIAVRDPDDADVIIFNGGADIGTEIYGEKPIYPGIPLNKSIRDADEFDIFEDYQGKKMLVGICRGSQFLNCLNGGTLWQDVDSHGRTHDMLDIRSGRIIQVTSTHHQQMRPNLKQGVLIGVASESTYKRADGSSKTLTPYRNAKNIKFPDNFETFPLSFRNSVTEELDVEIVWYPNTRSLCIQGHPEYVPGSEFAEYSRELILFCMSETKVTS